jgi:hypothetical protein
VAKPVLAELLRFIAANEQLPRTLERYKGYDRDVIGTLIAAAADRVEQAEAAAGDPPPARQPPGRKPGEARTAARPVEPGPATRMRLYRTGPETGRRGRGGVMG